MTKGEAIALWLKSKGITHSFGIIGGGNVNLWNAIHKLDYTKLICVHHEQAAAIAAANYFEVSGRIALVLVTTGAGSTNAITGVMNAWMDSKPILVISGNESSKYHHDGGRGFGFQGYRSWEVAKAFTKFAAPLAIGELDSALGIALEPRRGPVWLDIPRDTQNALA